MNRLTLYIKLVIVVLFLNSLAVFAFGQTGELGLQLSHTEYKEQVLNYSKEILKSIQNKKAMADAVRYAKAVMLPRLDFSSSAQYTLTSTTSSFVGISFDLPRDSYSLGTTLSQVIYNGGALSNTYKSAMIQDTIAMNKEELTLQEVLYASELAYWNAVAQGALYNSMSKYVEIVQTLVDILKIKFEDGYIAKTDYLQTLTNLKDAQVQQSEVYKSYQLAIQNLNVMMGVDPMSRTILTDSISLRLPELNYMGLYQVLEMRPDFKISKLQVDYQEKQLDIIKSNYNPQLSIGVNGSWGTASLNLDGSTSFGSAAFASLKIPIFGWGARNKRVSSQRAIIESAHLDAQIVSDLVSKQIANSWTEYRENIKQIDMTLQAAQIAYESMELNTFSYQEGKLNILDLLTSQLNWIQAQSSYIGAMLKEKSARVSYLKATGAIK